MGKKDIMDKVEEYDQWILGIVLLVVAALLIWKFQITLWLVIGFLVGLGGLFALNKGRKENVNLGSDITPIAFATVLLFAGIYYILNFGMDLLVIMFILSLIHI